MGRHFVNTKKIEILSRIEDGSLQINEAVKLYKVGRATIYRWIKSKDTFKNKKKKKYVNNKANGNLFQAILENFCMSDDEPIWLDKEALEIFLSEKLKVNVSRMTVNRILNKLSLEIENQRSASMKCESSNEVNYICVLAQMTYDEKNNLFKKRSANNKTNLSVIILQNFKNSKIFFLSKNRTIFKSKYFIKIVQKLLMKQPYKKIKIYFKSYSTMFSDKATLNFLRKNKRLVLIKMTS